MSGKGWGPWLGMYSETVHYHKMGNRAAFLTLCAFVLLTTTAIIVLYRQGWLQDASRLGVFIVLDALIALAAVYVLVRIMKGHSDIPFDPATHPSQRHPALYGREVPKQYDHYCPNCLHQSNRDGKCPKCRGARMKRTGEDNL